MPEAKQTTNQAPNPPTPVTTTLTSNPQSSVLFNSNGSVCLLKTAVTEVKSDKTSAVANVLFDEGAQRSFISQQLADALHLTPREYYFGTLWCQHHDPTKFGCSLY